MLRPDQFNDIDATWHRLVTVCGAIAGSLGTAAAMVGDLATHVLGVPLPVVLGAAAGAGLARSLVDATGFFRALTVSAAWTVAGCTGAPLVQSLAPIAAAKLFDSQLVLPTNALAGIALLISSSPLWWPKVWPMVSQWLPSRKAAPSNDKGAGQ